MERLTSTNPLTESESMNLSLTDLYARLKAYEDVGLAPEEIKKKLRTLRHYEDKFGDRPAKRWDELCKAEDQGRLIVLPCKVGDTVYWVPGFFNGSPILSARVAGFTYYSKNELRLVLPDLDIEPIYPNAHLFLSREEAEKALGG